MNAAKSEPIIDPYVSAAYGGEGWQPRHAHSRDELGVFWADYRVDNEWTPIRTVLVHEPAQEIEHIEDPNSVQMFGPLDTLRAQVQHRAICSAFQAEGVQVHSVSPATTPPPNQMFAADSVFMTPEGAILGRPASVVRAGEERHVARRLADLGIPILRTIRGHGTFEASDAAWLNNRTVLLATGLRTNQEGAQQVASMLRELGVDTIFVGLPGGALHLMSVLRFADRDLALGWKARLPWGAVDALRSHGYRILFLPNEVVANMALSFVTLGPRRILMPAGNPITQAFYEHAGITCRTVAVDELSKAGGGLGCLAAVLHRQPTG